MIPNVSVPANIISFGQHIMVSRRSKVVLPCLAVGQPLPKHSWTAPDGSLPQNEGFTVLKDGSLEISDVQRHYQGNYTCFVSNANGSDHIIYNLRVLGKIQILLVNNIFLQLFTPWFLLYTWIT